MDDTQILRAIRSDVGGALDSLWDGGPDANPLGWKGVTIEGERLVAINLEGCERLTALPAALGLCAALHTLNLANCGELTMLPAALGRCTALHTLNLARCVALAALPAELGQCGALHTLNLKFCGALTALPAELGQCGALHTLNLTGCEWLTALPAALGQCGALHTLNLARCVALTALPVALGQCGALHTLNLVGCERLTVLTAELGHCAALHTLNLSGCGRLTSLPAELGQCGALHTLNLTFCGALTALPSELGQCTALHTLNLVGCERLTALLAELGQCDALHTLDLLGCSQLTALPAALGLCGALHTLNLAGCEGLTALPAELGQCDALHTLNLAGGEGLTALTADLGQCGALHTLNLARCGRLTALPAELGQCAALHTLDLKFCEGLTALPAELGQCGALHTLNLRSCRSLTSLPVELGQCGVLHTLNLQYCEALTALPAELGQCAALHILNLEGCELVTALPAELGRCSVLQQFSDAALHITVQESFWSAPLGIAVKANPTLADHVNTEGRRAIDHAHPVCIRTMRAGLISAFQRMNISNTLPGPKDSASNSWAWHFLHESVEDPLMSTFLGIAVKTNPSLAYHTDLKGRRAIDHAHADCMLTMRAALLFMGRYDIDDEVALAHVSRTCAVTFAHDVRDTKTAGGNTGTAVALKFMSDPSAFDREVRFREQYQLDDTYLLGVKRTHGHLEGVAPLSTLCEDERNENRGDFLPELKVLLTKDARFRRAGGAEADVVNYAYCVVMPQAERTLAAALQHEHFAGQDWAKIRLIAAHLAEALSQMHKAGLLHGDVKPLNAVRHDGRWRLIDLDCACELKKPFGTKQPSTGYCPPEMARVIRAAKLAGATTGSAAMEAALTTYTANVAYDMWSLGVVLYQLFTKTGKTLFHSDQNDDVDGPELDRLCDWDDSARTEKLDFLMSEAAYDLLKKLLEMEPVARAAHFDGAMCRVLEHPFFSVGTQHLEVMVINRNSNASQLTTSVSQIHSSVSQMDSNVACQLESFKETLNDIATQLDNILSQLKARSRMTRALLSKDHNLPTYVVLLPKAAGVEMKGGGGMSSSAAAVRRVMKDPGCFFNDTVVVHFVDPVSLQFADTNGGDGFDITVPKECVAKAAPYLAWGLKVLSAAAANWARRRLSSAECGGGFAKIFGLVRRTRTTAPNCGGTGAGGAHHRCHQNY